MLLLFHKHSGSNFVSGPLGNEIRSRGYLFNCNFLNTIQHASIKMLYEK